MDDTPCTPQSGTLVVETNDFDVILGRGRKNSNRPGNVYFRAHVAERAPAYDSCGSVKNKHQLAERVIDHMHSKGGRFIRPVTAANRTGDVQSAWEVVSHDVTLGKVKQAMRDAVATRRSEIERQARDSLPSLESLYGTEAAKNEDNSEATIPPELQEQIPLMGQTSLANLMPQQYFALNHPSQLPAGWAAEAAAALTNSPSTSVHGITAQQVSAPALNHLSQQDSLARVLQHIREQQQQAQERLSGAAWSYQQLEALARMLQQNQQLQQQQQQQQPLNMAGQTSVLPIVNSMPQYLPPPGQVTTTSMVPQPPTRQFCSVPTLQVATTTTSILPQPHQQQPQQPSAAMTFGPLGLTLQQACTLQQILQAAAADASAASSSQQQLPSAAAGTAPVARSFSGRGVAASQATPTSPSSASSGTASSGMIKLKRSKSNNDSRRQRARGNKRRKSVSNQKSALSDPIIGNAAMVPQNAPLLIACGNHHQHVAGAGMASSPAAVFAAPQHQQTSSSSLSFRPISRVQQQPQNGTAVAADNSSSSSDASRDDPKQVAEL